MLATATNLVIDGYRFAYVERGQGEPVVFVHGSFSDHRSWRGQLRTLSANYRAIAYSRRYHWPNAPIAERTDYGMDQQVADLAAVIERLGVAPCHLVGHSYGALLCLLLAIRQPELAQSLVLAEPPVISLFISNPPKLVEILKLFASRPRTAATIMAFGARGLAPATKAFRKGDLEEGLRIFGDAVLGREAFAALSADRRQQARDNIIAAEFTGSGFSPMRDDWIRGVRQPVLLPLGTRSPPLFRRLRQRLQELLPDARRVDIPGASHIVHEDNPQAFDRAVIDFLASQ